MPRQTNAAGLALYHEFEQGPGGGPALTAYRCPAGVLTIGWGHTGPDVHEGQTITAAEADRLLDMDLDEAERDVERAVTVPTNDNAFAALVSLRFNIGTTGFRKSTVLKRHNAGDWAGAAQAFAMWNKATNAKGRRVVLNGLVRRRAAEAALYMTPTADSQAHDPQRTRAADVEATPDRLAPVARIGGTIAATATAAQQVVIQVGGVHQALVGVGINPQLAILLLAVAAGVGIWWATRRRAG
ncbi:MAG: lysozyme [Alphaproteobacteria bacterium]|jgi:lysozyme|nr:lysozyme [Alphaproteobacteria bacterium]